MSEENRARLHRWPNDLPIMPGGLCRFERFGLIVEVFRGESEKSSSSRENLLGRTWAA